MWESPIQMITDDIIKDIARKEDEWLMESVHRVGCNIDKDELVKALKYDRDQYEKGYADGRRARDSEIVHCKDCIHGIPTRIDTETWTVSYERYCNRHRMVHFGDYYCADGKRPENAVKCSDCKNYEHWFGDNYLCADSGMVVSEDETCPYWRGKEGGADGR